MIPGYVRIRRATRRQPRPPGATPGFRREALAWAHQGPDGRISWPPPDEEDEADAEVTEWNPTTFSVDSSVPCEGTTWEYKGFALPLRPWTGSCQFDSGMHVSTTSTCTIHIPERNAYRTYMPGQRLVQNEPEWVDGDPSSGPVQTDGQVAHVFSASPAHEGTGLPCDLSSSVYGECSAIWGGTRCWALHESFDYIDDPRFPQDFVGFVDFTDATETTPVYGPELPGSGDLESPDCTNDTTTATYAYGDALEDAHCTAFTSEIGWTGIQALPTADADTTYRDVTVVHLARSPTDTQPWYAMFLIECQLPPGSGACASGSMD